MAKRQTRLALNEPDPKHAGSQRRRKPVGAKPVCLTCNTIGCTDHNNVITPDDPGWANAVRRVSAPALPPPLRLPKPPPKVFDPPEWAARVARSSYSWDAPPTLTYLGVSRMCGAKAGRRKHVRSHGFRVESGPIPFDEETTFLWHGTALMSAESIVRDTFRPSSGGLLGPGVYLGDLAKARNYVRGSSSEWGVLLYVEAALGRVGLANEVDFKNLNCDTIHAAAGALGRAWGGSIRRREWCVRDPNRVRVREIHIVPVWAAR